MKINIPFSFKGKEYITIPLSYYNELEESDEFLSALEFAGVDNWIGYDDVKSRCNEE